MIPVTSGGSIVAVAQRERENHGVLIAFAVGVLVGLVLGIALDVGAVLALRLS